MSLKTYTTSAPFGWNFVVASIAGVAFSFSQPEAPAFIVGSLILFFVGLGGIYLGDRAVAKKDLTVKGLLILFLGAELAEMDLPSARIILLVALALLGLLVLDGAIREWGGGL